MGFQNSLLLQTDVSGVPDYFQEALTEVISFLPQLVGAVVILLIGRLLGGGVSRVADLTQVDRLVMRTPLDGRDYVAENIGEWVPGRSPDTEPSPLGQADGGKEL